MKNARRYILFLIAAIFLARATHAETVPPENTSPPLTNPLLIDVPVALSKTMLSPLLMLPPVRPVPLGIPMEKRNAELSVNSRTDPELDPQGAQVGAFRVFPSISAAGTYIDNVFYRSGNKLSDYIYSIKPDIIVVSDFVRHALGFEVNAEKGIFKRVTGDNYLDYNAAANGRLDLGGDTHIPFVIGYGRDEASRSSPEDRFDVHRASYGTMTGNTGLDYVGSLWEASVHGGLVSYSYDDTPTIGGFIDNRDQDRDEWSGNAEAGILPRGFLTPFLYSSFKKIVYSHQFQNGDFDRDATNLQGGVGAHFSFSNVTQSIFQIGYVNRHIKDPRFRDVNALAYSLALNWEPSTLASFSATGNRTIGQTSLFNFSSSVDTSLLLSAKYELTPKILILPKMQFLDRAYRGLSHGEIQQWTYGSDLTYKLNSNVWATLDLTHSNQNDVVKSPALSDYTNNVIGVTLKFQR